jgi:hypothetical protein
MAVMAILQCYQYDTVGNIEKMKHDTVGSNGSEIMNMKQRITVKDDTNWYTSIYGILIMRTMASLHRCHTAGNGMEFQRRVSKEPQNKSKPR